MNILFLCHNHPSFHPGGTEIFALDLFRTLRQQGHQGVFLGCVDRAHREQRPGTVFQGIGATSDEMLMWTGHFERFFLSQVDLHSIVPELRSLLTYQKFDVVHLHHILLMGLEVLPVIRNTLPDTRIVMTLHDYYPLCNNDGMMITTSGGKLCHMPTPDKCHACFPGLDTEKFVLRDLNTRNHLDCVDQFISPSEFLKERYVAWGIPADKITVIRNARPAHPASPPRALRPDDKRNHFTYMGNISPHKGLPVLLDAVRLLAERHKGGFHVAIHGDMPFQKKAFQERIKADIDSLREYVHWSGAYEAADVPTLLADTDWLVMPSVWWENAPLVIQEAFQQGRPVIASNIGGMKEAVQHGKNGLTFRMGDAWHLAATMEQAMTEEGLWDRLASGVTAPWSLDECATAHGALYRK